MFRISWRQRSPQGSSHFPHTKSRGVVQISYWPQFWGATQANDGVANGASAYFWYNQWFMALWKEMTIAGINQIHIGDTFTVYDQIFTVTAIQPSQFLVQNGETTEVFSVPHWPWASKGV